jgi:hypothetical protein
MQRLAPSQCHEEKKMKINLSTILMIFAVLLISCEKTTSQAPATISLRVENATSESFSNFAVNSTKFGPISIGITTKYFLCRNVLPLPFANQIAINNNFIYIEDIVPTPYLKDGKYRMKVVKDSLPYSYQASFIKE